MLCFLQLFFISLLVSSTAWSSPVDDGPVAEVDAAASKSSFHELLSSVNAVSVHLAMHALSWKYRDGVFATPANAVEALHKEDASLATQVLKLARRHKHSNNTTSSSSQSSPTSMKSSQTSASSSSTSTSTSTSTESHTTAPTSTTTTSTSTAPVTSPSSSNTQTTSIASSSSSTEQTTFSTSATMLTSSSTTTNKLTPFTSTYHSTTTLSNGEVSTVTAVTVIHPTPTVVATGTGASASPSLQTGDAVALNSQGLTKEILAMLGGAVAVAWAL